MFLKGKLSHYFVYNQVNVYVVIFFERPLLEAITEYFLLSFKITWKSKLWNEMKKNRVIVKEN